MFKKIKKWGNSLALRIPKREAKQLGLRENKQVSVKKEGEKLVIKPKENKLKNLLDQINEENLQNAQFPEEKPKGNEIW